MAAISRAYGLANAISAAVCALIQTRADYATRCGPCYVSEPIPDLVRSRLCIAEVVGPYRSVSSVHVTNDLDATLVTASSDKEVAVAYL